MASTNPLTEGRLGHSSAAAFPPSNVGRINLAIAASSPSTLYAAVQNSPSFALLGVWKSTDGGASWSQLSATNASCGTQCWYDLYLAVDPTNASTVYFGGEDVFKSTDGGSTFTDLGGYNGGDIHPDQHALAFAPGNSSTIVIGNDGGVFKTTNGGSSWSSLNQALTLEPVRARAFHHSQRRRNARRNPGQWH